MRHWTRTPNATLCGNCSSELREGAAVLLVKLPNVKRELVRGECCAGEAPPDLPAIQLPGSRTKKLTKLAKSRPEWLPHPAD